MDIFYLKEENFFNFLDSLKIEYELLVPVKSENQKLRSCPFGQEVGVFDYLLKDYSALKKEDFSFNPYRTLEPIKTYFSPLKETISKYFADTFKSSQDKPLAIFGVKNCDLFSLKIQDFVFKEGTVQDPFYVERRNNNLIITSDCSSFKEVCFCLAMNILPYVTEGFDLNFSLLNDGFLVEVGSEKAKKIIALNSHYFKPASLTQISIRDKKRENFILSLKKHLEYHPIPETDKIPSLVRKSYDSSLWKEYVLNCVECGGCNLVCDTCHCFLLSDERFGNANERIRTWDACLYANFAKVAGGANPLKFRYQRLRNRYLKKFDFFPQNLGLLACCGCGRCIEVCPAKIDIREVLRKLGELGS
jgi:ferredoxin